MATKETDSKPKSSDALKKMRAEQSAAKPAKVADKKKAKSKPAQKGKKALAKPKAKPAEKPQSVAKGKGRSDSRTDSGELMSPKDLQAKADRAAEVTQDLKDAIIGAANSRVALIASVKIAQEEESWKWGQFKHEDGTIGPFRNWETYLLSIGKELNRGKSVMLEASGLVRWLKKWLTVEDIANLPVRNARKLRGAAEQADKQGRELPANVIDAARQPGKEGESATRAAIEEANLVPPETPQASEDQEKMFAGDSEDDITSETESRGHVYAKPDPLLAKSHTDTFPESPRKGGSGAVNGKSGEAEQYDSLIRQAFAVYRRIYDKDANDVEILKTICGKFLNAECQDKDFQDMTNIQAFDHLEQQRKAAGV